MEWVGYSLALFAPTPLLLMLVGTTLGIVVGAIPGLSGTMLISLTLPLTFAMSPLNAIVLLIAMYVGAISGGLISATLLRMPGTPSSIMTTFDGYPMAQQGKAARALGLGIVASFVGGLLSWVVLVLLTRPLADLAAGFGPFEKFSLVMMALVLIAAVSEGSLLRGLIAGLLGMLVAMPGVDPALGGLRLTFGFNFLDAGLDLAPVLIGVFAVSQIIRDSSDIEGQPPQIHDIGTRDVLLPWRDWKRHGGNMLQSSAIGTWIGILPGIGANIASVVAYTFARRVSKEPEKFGKGSEEGIIASEAANNASVGGALVPLIAMGIPGSVIDAVLLGAFAMHALTPGTLLFQNNPDLVAAMMGSALIANFMMFVLMVLTARYIAKLCAVPRAFLLPLIMFFCVVGTFALRGNMLDVWVMLGFGLVGLALEACRIPLGPFVIGLVLAPIAEINLRSGLMISAGSIEPLFTRPISAVFMFVAIVLLAWQLREELIVSRQTRRV
ncbi:tripartite tricarboxylate transporter permease [Devosia beringensis]|uniref:tripartite tricarboxylate transporter permease n=1 Tax=Devosia beringensis TaxID=2657486 RepID=UPI001E4709C8|nr:tripartite tricarboxylate transporter permease [Devosia beringensis]